MKINQYIAHQLDTIQKCETLVMILRQGLKLTDEEMARAKQLAELARKSGAPVRFLSAVTAVVRKPMFLPCGCWWCRLKRKLSRG